MSTTVLSKKQQRHSLSAKKTPVKGLRNVLVQSHENYWPMVDSKTGIVLEGVMEQLIKVIRRPAAKLPWSRLRLIKREERALERDRVLFQQENVLRTSLLGSVITGINAITRALERKSVCCVLLDSNVEPSLLIKHVVIMAQNKQVPILLVPFLKRVTAAAIGYASASFALKNAVAESTDHHFHSLFSIISNAVGNALHPKKTLHLSKTTDTCSTSSRKEIEVPELVVSEPVTLWSNKSSVSRDVYKYRTSDRKRAFVPSNTVEAIGMITTTPADYISISQYNAPTTDDEDEILPSKRARITRDSRSKSDVQYLSLKVIRQQGNIGRVKATKASLKKKK